MSSSISNPPDRYYQRLGTKVKSIFTDIPLSQTPMEANHSTLFHSPTNSESNKSTTPISALATTRQTRTPNSAATTPVDQPDPPPSRDNSNDIIVMSWNGDDSRFRHHCLCRGGWECNPAYWNCTCRLYKTKCGPGCACSRTMCDNRARTKL